MPEYVNAHDDELAASVAVVDAYVDVDAAVAMVDKNSPAKFIPFKEILDATRNFSLDSFVGKGNYGFVYWATMELVAPGDGVLQPRTRKVAVKVSKNAPERPEAVLGDIKEVDTIWGLESNPNVVSCLGYSRVDQPIELELPLGARNNAEDGKIGRHALCIVFDFIDGIPLEKWLRAGIEAPYSGPRPPLSWDERVGILFDIASGLAHLHHPNGILHRDLRSANVLVQQKPGDGATARRFEAVITDFGLSAHIEENGIYMPVLRPNIGAVGCADPQYVLNGTFTLNNDVYSFGMIVLELVTGVTAAGTAEPLRLFQRYENHPNRAAMLADKEAPAPEDPWPAEYMIEKLLTLACSCVLQERRPTALYCKRIIAGIMGLELEDERGTASPPISPKEDALNLPGSPEPSRRNLNPEINPARTSPQEQQQPTPDSPGPESPARLRSSSLSGSFRSLISSASNSLRSLRSLFSSPTK